MARPDDDRIVSAQFLPPFRSFSASCTLDTVSWQDFRAYTRKLASRRQFSYYLSPAQE
jgi:hypothetical protein